MVAVETELPTVSSAPSVDAIPLKLRRSGGSPRQVFVIALVGALVLAMFASHDLSTWLERMGDGPILAPMQRAAAEWDEAMGKLGLTSPHQVLRLAIRRLLDWEWGGPP
jgi:hypothetical protein